MMNNASNGLPKERKLKDTLIIDRWGFLIAVVVGAAAILAGKWVELPQWQVTSCAIATMLLYAVILGMSPRFSLREDQAGDNLYYLGLLLTLVSLGWALHAFDESGGAGQIVQSFGMALATTGVGLALRVVFNQMRQNLVQIEKESRMQLAQAASALRAELDQVVVSMNDFRRVTQQATAESFLELKDVVDSAVKKCADGLVATSEDIAKRLATAFEGLEQQARRFEESASTMVGSLEAYTQAMGRISGATQAVDTDVAALAKAATTAERGLHALIKRTTEIQAAQAALREAAAASQQVLVTQKEVATNLKSTVEGLGAQLTTAASAWQAVVGGAREQIAAEHAKTFSILDQQIEVLQQEQGKALQNLTATLAATVEALKEHQTNMAIELEKSRGYTLKVHNALAEMTDELASRLAPATVRKATAENASQGSVHLTLLD